MGKGNEDLVRVNGHKRPAVAEAVEAAGGASAIEGAVRTLLREVGEDPDRAGLQGTPERVARMYEELFAGYTVDPVALLNGALFDVAYDELVLVKNIEYFSMCEHHMLPFFGVAHVAYVPREKVVGLSKIPRLVEMYARRLQIQERMTRQIAVQLEALLQPRGVAVVVEGMHLCSMMRGVRQREARMVTRSLRGVFGANQGLQEAFLQQIGAR